MDQSIKDIRDKIGDKIAEAERLKAALPADRSDSEMRAFELGSVIRDGRRELTALDAYESGQNTWPNERGPRT